MKKPVHFGIVGGGMLGMTLAWELAKAGDRVSVFETAAQPGGLAGAWQLGDIVWDRYYHVTLSSDAALRALLSELDLDCEMQWRKTRAGFYWNGRLHSFSGAIDFARFPLLDPMEKIRFAAGIYRAARLRSPAAIDSLTVEEWLTHLFGQGVFQKFWVPLLCSKLGEEWRTTSAPFMWATIQRMFAARRSRLQPELFGYLPGGYARMLDVFVAALRGKGVCFRLGAAVQRVGPGRDGRVNIECAGAAGEPFDRVVVTIPAPLAARLCPGLSSHETKLLCGVEYQGIICASLLLRQPLSAFYITNIADCSIPLTGVIEMSNLVDCRHFGGHTLAYLPRYVRPDDPAFQETDSRLQEQLFDALRRMHGSLQQSEVLASRVSRSRYVFVRPTPGFAGHIPPVDTSIPGVHILNSAHIVGGTLNVNETVQLARHQARRIHELAA